MSEISLEARVARLESQMAVVLQKNGGVTDISATPPLGMEPGRDDWKKTVGMFRGDPLFEQMLEEVSRRREEDRRRVRESQGDEGGK